MIRAIETRYAGCRFRSRLEARWAVFFDHLGIKWEYEPQGYEVGPYPTDVTDNGATIKTSAYLPDFWLPELRKFIEVKGVEPDENYRQMLAAFVEQAEADLLLVVGSIPADEAPGMDLYAAFPYTEPDGVERYRCSFDYDHRWCSCASGRHLGIEYLGYGDRIECTCSGPSSNDKTAILNALRAARSARFEHGERP